MLKLIGPWNLPTSKTRNFSPNLNQYRNAHYRVLSQMKREYADIIKEQLKDPKKMETVRVTLVAYPPTKMKFDLDNLAPHMKFAMDAVVQMGVLEDDNYLYILSTEHLFGGVDKENPRVEFFIEEITIEELTDGRKRYLNSADD